MNDQEYLIHYGVLGMKWGVKKKIDSGGLSDRKSRRIEKRLSKFEKNFDTYGNRRRVAESMKKRGYGTNSKSFKAYKKAGERYNAASDRYEKSNKSRRGMEKAADDLYNAREDYYQAQRKHYKSSKEVFKSLDTNQKMRVMKDVNISKGKSLATQIGMGALAGLAGYAVISSKRKIK